MRNYRNIDRYLDILAEDIYPQPQPENDAHTAWAKAAIELLLPEEGISVLDVGCGLGFCKPLFEEYDCDWTGITLEEIDGVKYMDMSFLENFDDNSFDLIFARHILEHSPMPLLTLMEWHRVARYYAIIILPTPEYWNVGGRNHYYVLPEENWVALFEFAGWFTSGVSMGLWTRDKLFLDWYPSQVAPQPHTFPDPQMQVEYWFLLEK